MAWTSLNEEASGYYQCLSVHQAGTGVSHPNGQVYRNLMCLSFIVFNLVFFNDMGES